MASSLNITDSERTVLIDFHRATAQTLRSEIDRLTAERIECERRIDELLDTGSSDEPYSDDWTLARKAEFVLRELGRISNTRTIAEVIHLKEFILDDIRTTVSNLGATLKQKVDRGVTFNRVEQYADIFYGLGSWFDEDGAVKDAYQVAPTRTFTENNDAPF